MILMSFFYIFVFILLLFLVLSLLSQIVFFFLFDLYVCMCVLSCFNHVQLCDPMDCSMPVSCVHGILQAWILVWVAMHSKGTFQPRDWTQVSYISCIGRQVVLTTSTTWEALLICILADLNVYLLLFYVKMTFWYFF